MKTSWMAVALCGLVGAVGCGGDDGGGDLDPGAWAYPETKMVVTELLLPRSTAEAKQYGLDLPHHGTVDNRLGTFLAVLSSAMDDTSPHVSVDEAMGNGDLILLFSVFAQDLQESGKANLWAFLGQPVAIDPPTGPAPGDTFTVDTAAGSRDGYFGGRIKGGRGVFGGDNATLTINLPSAGGRLELTLHSVSLEFDVAASCTATSCEITNGRLGGAISERDLNATVLPEVVNLLQRQLDGKCRLVSGRCVCESGSVAERVENTFDRPPVGNQDCTITLEELQNHDGLKAFLESDVTLKDGTRALSVAAGFSAVNAVHARPAPPARQ